jgi:hypothetical protein
MQSTDHSLRHLLLAIPDTLFALFRCFFFGLQAWEEKWIAFTASKLRI